MNYTKQEAEKEYPGVRFEGEVWIGTGARIRQGAWIESGAKIGKGAWIREDAEIGQGAVIGKGAMIGKGRKNVSDNIVIIGIGETKNITAFKCDDGLIICIGCMNDYKGLGYSETLKELVKKYTPDHEYFDAMRLIKKWYDRLVKA